MHLTIPNNVPSLQDILTLQDAVRHLHQIDIPLFHHFAEDLYAREVHLPKGAFIVGKMHKTIHFNILAKGKLIVWTEGGMQTVEAPWSITSLPGTKRAVYVLEDAVWFTCHGTPETDLEKLEADLIIPEDQINLYLGDTKWLGLLSQV